MKARRKTRKRKQKGGNNLSVNLQITPTSNTYSKQQFENSGTPIVEWKAARPYYTLLCVDPDSSQPAWLHWLVVNCKGDSPSTGISLINWEPPTPPTGTHRYFFNLYSHAYPLAIDAPNSRSAFNTDEFVSENGLKLVDQFMVRVKA